MLVRAATIADLGSLRKLSVDAAWTPAWSERAWESVLVDEAARYIVLLAEEEAAARGFVAASVVLDVAEIENFAVEASFQRRGMAGMLLEHLRQEALRRDVAKLQLEVNEHNRAARAFYVAMGFREDGRREKYYFGEQAAVLMGMELRKRVGDGPA
jgi:ribosomal-protein-alanine N-acetyltransferase